MPTVITRGALSALGFQTQRPLSWNPNDKGASTTLSNNNLTATDSAGVNTYTGVRGTIGRLVGNYQFDISVTTGSANTGVGVGTTSAPLNAALGNDTASIAYFPLVGVFFNGVQVATPGAYTTGDTLGVRVDFSTMLAYFRNPAGVWTSGLDISTMSTPLFPIINLYAPSSAFTLIPRPASLASGARAWGNP